ncbi:MAG: hypothetical protein K2Y71_26160 [Xanthobacteraceae bacterium]|jgi:hypothetical protein|nr:hypothetical protein [Xanthobacteraceae bacterium]
MGTVVEFPELGRSTRDGRVIGMRAESATVIILPVIRIERYDDEPAERGASRSQRRRRRRRASRSKASA